MRQTHGTTEVRETHKGQNYLVPKRTPGETARLRVLAADLYKAGEYTVTRRVGHNIVRIFIDADTPTYAKWVADQVAYALRWKAFGWSRDTTKPTPEQEWLEYRDYEEVRG